MRCLLAVASAVVLTACVGQFEITMTNNCDVDVSYAALPEAAGGFNPQWQTLAAGETVDLGRFDDTGGIDLSVSTNGDEVWDPTLLLPWDLPGEADGERMIDLSGPEWCS